MEYSSSSLDVFLNPLGGMSLVIEEWDIGKYRTDSVSELQSGGRLVPCALDQSLRVGCSKLVQSLKNLLVSKITTLTSLLLFNNITCKNIT